MFILCQWNNKLLSTISILTIIRVHNTVRWIWCIVHGCKFLHHFIDFITIRRHYIRGRHFDDVFDCSTYITLNRFSVRTAMYSGIGYKKNLTRKVDIRCVYIITHKRTNIDWSNKPIWSVHISIFMCILCRADNDFMYKQSYTIRHFYYVLP